MPVSFDLDLTDFKNLSGLVSLAYPLKLRHQSNTIVTGPSF